MFLRQVRSLLLTEVVITVNATLPMAERARKEDLWTRY